MFRTVVFTFSVQVSPVGYSIIPCLLDCGGEGGEGQWAENLSVRGG